MINTSGISGDRCSERRAPGPPNDTHFETREFIMKILSYETGPLGQSIIYEEEGTIHLLPLRLGESFEEAGKRLLKRVGKSAVSRHGASSRTSSEAAHD